jgi:hypothetical protein
MKYKILFLVSLLSFSCTDKSEFSEDFSCSNSAFNNIEMVDDIKNLFSIQLPVNWKINLYKDEVQLSVFALDTPKKTYRNYFIRCNFYQQ